MVADALLTTVGASSGIVYLMQKLKESKFPLVQEGQRTLNRLVSIGGAALMQAGINYTWNPGSHTLAISGLTLSATGFALWHIYCQFSIQEVIYQAAINKPVAPSLTQQDVLTKDGAQVVAETPKQAGK